MVNKKYWDSVDKSVLDIPIIEFIDLKDAINCIKGHFRNMGILNEFIITGKEFQTKYKIKVERK